MADNTNSIKSTATVGKPAKWVIVISVVMILVAVAWKSYEKYQKKSAEARVQQQQITSWSQKEVFKISPVKATDWHKMPNGPFRFYLSSGEALIWLEGVERPFQLGKGYAEFGNTRSEKFKAMALGGREIWLYVFEGSQGV
jgi:hypothetical protein